MDDMNKWIKIIEGQLFDDLCKYDTMYITHLYNKITASGVIIRHNRFISGGEIKPLNSHTDIINHILIRKYTIYITAMPLGLSIGNRNEYYNVINKWCNYDRDADRDDRLDQRNLIKSNTLKSELNEEVHELIEHNPDDNVVITIQKSYDSKLINSTHMKYSTYLI